jgi:hypothetical protein
MLEAPVGRADAFGAGVSPEAVGDKTAAVPAAAATPAVATSR